MLESQLPKNGSRIKTYFTLSKCMNEFSYDIQPLCSTVPFPRTWNNGTDLKSAEQPPEQGWNIFSQSLSKQGFGEEQGTEHIWNKALKTCSTSVSKLRCLWNKGAIARPCSYETRMKQTISPVESH